MLLTLAFVAGLWTACTSDAVPEDDARADSAESASGEPVLEAPAREEFAEEDLERETGLLDINLAATEEFTAVGIPSAAADVLVDGRPFENMLQVDAALASVLDEAAREAVYRVAWISIDLNGAGREEILLIPGVGNRMAHEFEEYRPYERMADFRREIGKYVDDEEVERLAQYVSLD